MIHKLTQPVCPIILIGRKRKVRHLTSNDIVIHLNVSERTIQSLVSREIYTELALQRLTFKILFSVLCSVLYLVHWTLWWLMCYDSVYDTKAVIYTSRILYKSMLGGKSDALKSVKNLLQMYIKEGIILSSILWISLVYRTYSVAMINYLFFHLCC